MSNDLINDQSAAQSPCTFRLDPKLAYGLRLLARKRHQKVSQTLRWIIQQAIDGKLGDGL
jgi:hypothetical protein